MAEIIKGATTTTTKLVKKESFGAMLDAVAILDAAREQARGVLREAESERQRMLESARLEGEAEGLHRYLSAIEDVTRQADSYFASAEAQLVRLSTGIARKIVGEELRASPETIARIVREALGSVRQARRVTVKVDPTHVESLRTQTHLLELSSSCDLQVTGSTAAGPGGCLIESDLGLVDARLDTQLRVIENVLAKAAAERGTARA
jgi:type III secretion protein L